MRSIVFAVIAFVGAGFCVMHEVSAQKSDSALSNAEIPMALSKRGGKGHGHGRRGHHKHGDHGKKGGEEKSADDSGSKGGDDVVSSIAKNIEGVPKLLNPLSQIKLPAGAVIFGISLSCFHEVNARLHKHKLDNNKRIFRRFVDISSILGANGLPNTLSQLQGAQPQGNSAPASAGYSAPPSGSPPPPAAQPAAPLLPTTITPPSLIAPLAVPAPAVPAPPSIPTNLFPPLNLFLPGNDEFTLPDASGLFGAPTED